MALLRSYVATCCFTYDLPGQHALPAGRSSCGTGPMPCAACSGGPPAPRGSPGRGAAGAARRSPTPTCPRAGPQRTGGPPAHGGARASGRRTGHKNSGGLDPTGGGGVSCPAVCFLPVPHPPPCPHHRRRAAFPPPQHGHPSGWQRTVRHVTCIAASRRFRELQQRLRGNWFPRTRTTATTVTERSVGT